MGSSANIREIASLSELRLAIAKFCEVNENQLFIIDSNIQSRIGRLYSLESHFQQILEAAKDDLHIANRAYTSCEADTYEDDDGNISYPNCDYEKQVVIECRKRLELAEHNYNVFKREIRNLETSINEFQISNIKYKSFIQFEKEVAINSLKQLINGAEDYLSVSTPFSYTFLNGNGQTKKNEKDDTKMALAATTVVPELIFMSVFSFFGLSGRLFSVSNKMKNGLITTTYTEDGTEHICSEIKIEKKNTVSYGKIISVCIPGCLANEETGKHLIQNMEANCRANDCIEMYGWSNEANTSFYKGLGYQTRNMIKDAGSEVFKPLYSDFSSLQQNAKSAFQNLKNYDFINATNIGRQDINPLYVVSTNEVYDDKFWSQHGLDQTKYIDLIEKYQKCKNELSNGRTLDDIRNDDFWVANAHDVFHGSEPIRLLKYGNYYQIDSNGRHRVAAAQMYYLKTEIIVTLPADVIEKRKL